MNDSTEARVSSLLNCVEDSTIGRVTSMRLVVATA
jgi:hypothetical protein